MYALSNKKSVDKQFAAQEHRCTLLKRQNESDLQQLVDDVDTSPMLHHSMARQARSDNVWSLPQFLTDHVNDPATKASNTGHCVRAAATSSHTP